MARVAGRSLVPVLLTVVVYQTLDLCFSRISSTRTLETEPPPTSEAPAATAWLRAARRTAEGKRDSGAHWTAAWESTEAWWLRPVALLVTALFTSVAIVQQLPGAYLRAIVAKKPKVTELRPGEMVFQERPMTMEMRREMRVRKCLSAFQRMELPLFGTSASWSEKDSGVLVSVNPRTTAVLEDWPGHVDFLKDTVDQALDAESLNEKETVLHLLRQEDDSYQLLVRFVTPSSESSPFDGMSALMSLGLVYLATQWDSALRATSSDDLAVLALALLPVLLSELARELTARAQSVKMANRTFLPSPQLSLLGTFCTPSTASPNKTAQLQLALSAPLTLATLALLLGALDRCRCRARQVDTKVDRSKAMKLTPADACALQKALRDNHSLSGDMKQMIETVIDTNLVSKQAHTASSSGSTPDASMTTFMEMASGFMKMMANMTQNKSSGTLSNLVISPKKEEESTAPPSTKPQALPALEVEPFKPKMRTSTSGSGGDLLPLENGEVTQQDAPGDSGDGSVIEQAAFDALVSREAAKKATKKASTKEDFVYDPGFPGAEWKGRSYESWTSKHYHAARELARNQGLSDDDAKGCAREARAKSAETWKATFKQ
ncbi:unnamed protein product [Durusdinium trenchii]|uniref:Uncharacterized protein n=1 Tax=Durusdinium trenchii TaxID=1381693 RepID=A0ABP0Q5P2_9DINO